jgi:hypothetical protein
VLSDQTLADQTVVAGATSLTVSGVLLDSNAVAAVGKWVRFGTSFGPVPDSAQADGSGTYSRVWTPPDSAASYTLTGVRGAASPLLSVADSAGRIVMRRTIQVVPDVPSPLKSTAAISATTIAVNGTAVITINVKDRFGNLVKNATPTAFTVTAAVGRGAVGAPACTLGVCTVTYTAPATAGTDTISVKIGVTNVLQSPIALIIQ